MNETQTAFKIKDNYAIIATIVNKNRISRNWRARLLETNQIDLMVKNKMETLNCSKLEATEIIKKEVKEGLIK